MPAIQAVLRSMVAVAAKGNGPVQRALIGTIQAIERERAAQEHTGKDGAAIQPQHKDMTSVELARRFAEIISEAAKKRAAGNE